jgi:hypothetical protein
VLVPLALAQFICSFAGSNMNPAGHGRADDPCGKLTDRYGRKRCVTIGLVV